MSIVKSCSVHVSVTSLTTKKLSTHFNKLWIPAALYIATSMITTLQHLKPWTLQPCPHRPSHPSRHRLGANSVGWADGCDLVCCGNKTVWEPSGSTRITAATLLNVLQTVEKSSELILVLMLRSWVWHILNHTQIAWVGLWDQPWTDGGCVKRSYSVFELLWHISSGVPIGSLLIGYVRIYEQWIKARRAVIFETYECAIDFHRFQHQIHHSNL